VVLVVLVVERLYIQRGGFRRLPDLKISIFAILVDGCVVWLPGLERLGGGVDVEVVTFTCCMVRFMPGKVFVGGECLLRLLSGCSGFGGPLDCIGVF